MSASTHGPLIHQRAVSKVDEHVRDAIAKGAKLLAGGRRGEGNFYEPTILSYVSLDAELNADETFGPLAACIPFDTEDQVIQMANDTEFGLAG